MSHFSQATVLVGQLPLDRGQWFEQHRHHEHHQLVWTSRGVLEVRVDDRTWVLPTGLALWVPVGTAHATGASTRADMHGVFVEPRQCPIDLSQPTAVTVGPLARELLRHLARTDLASTAREHAEALVFDQLPVAPELRLLDVTVPTEARASTIADALLADPAGHRTLARWGPEVGASERTLARLWPTETGISFARWRTRVRLRAALPLLADGTPVGTVGGLVGYTTASGFVAAFRREVGVSPGAYFTGAVGRPGAPSPATQAMSG